MNRNRVKPPSYRLHKPSGQAVVTLSGQDLYLGAHDSPESVAEYDRLIAEWLANGRRPPRRAGRRFTPATDTTIIELIVAYVEYAEGYYRKGGAPTSEVGNVKLALWPLRELFGPTSAADFGPLALKAVRNRMIASDICRNEVNKRTQHIVRMFRWAAENEIVPSGVYLALKTVRWLARGRSEARESNPVRPVPDAFVDAVRPHVPRQIWTMIELQRLTGMRPGEVCSMRTCDIDTTGKVWRYRPESHKTEHRGKVRVIYFGPRARDVLRPWLRTELVAYLFSPAEAMAERKAARRAARKSKVQPSQQDRSKKRPARKPGDRYDVPAYNRAIASACVKAKVDHWHPHQLRHNAATSLRKEFGIETARAVLGHSSMAMTEIYAEMDGEKAAQAMERVG